jgi:serine/threonine protein phosphatase 1
MMRTRGAANAVPISASTPPDTRIYAVGDIHGRADLLTEVIERIERDLERRPVGRSVEIYLGDYIDRGPDSKDVIDLLAVRLVQGRAVCLRGNHEDMMERFLHDPHHLEAWLRLGGLQTLASYGVVQRSGHAEGEEILHQRFRKAFPRAHELFLKCLKPWCACGDFLFVHAGIRPGVPLEQQTLGDLLWIRDEFLSSQHDHGKLIVHGHTPVPHPDIHANRINIDTGACWSSTLTCLAIEGTSLLFI